MINNEGNSEIKLWKLMYSKIHCQPLNSSTFSGSRLQKAMMFLPDDNISLLFKSMILQITYRVCE